MTFTAKNMPAEEKTSTGMLEWQFAEACSEKMLHGGIKLVVAVVCVIQGVLPLATGST